MPSRHATLAFNSAFCSAESGRVNERRSSRCSFSTTPYSARRASQRRAYTLADAISVIELVRNPRGLRSAELAPLQAWKPTVCALPERTGPYTPSSVAPARPPLPMTRRRRGRLPSHWHPRDIQTQTLCVPCIYISAPCRVICEIRKVPIVDNRASRTSPSHCDQAQL